MIRKATQADIGQMVAFLEERIAHSMFLLGNLEAHGVGNTKHPHGTSFFLRETGEGITGVFGATNGGFLMCQLPGLSATEAQTYTHLLKGYTVTGMTGDMLQMDEILGALRIPADALSLNRVEPLYRLTLSGLGAAPAVRQARETDVTLLADWWARYLSETGTCPPARIDREAAVRARAAVGSPDTQIMEERGRPVAMARINARARRAVQVGGVFVPETFRGEGRAGRVVSGLLATARARGAELAILFAASPAAAKAYERIGFVRCGDYRVTILRDPLPLGAAA